MNTHTPSFMATAPLLSLPIPHDSPTQFWQHSETTYTTAGSRWQAALNQACLDALLPWLKAEQCPSAKIWTKAASRPSFWELVEGSIVTVGE